MIIYNLLFHLLNLLFCMINNHFLDLCNIQLRFLLKDLLCLLILFFRLIHMNRLLFRLNLNKIQILFEDCYIKNHNLLMLLLIIVFLFVVVELIENFVDFDLLLEQLLIIKYFLVVNRNHLLQQYYNYK